MINILFEKKYAVTISVSPQIATRKAYSLPELDYLFIGLNAVMRIFLANHDTNPKTPAWLASSHFHGLMEYKMRNNHKNICFTK